MKCSYCKDLAVFKCSCEQHAYMCPLHLSPHLATIPNHTFEYMDIVLENSKFQEFKSSIKIRLKELAQAKAEISTKSKALIQEIKSLSKQACLKLENISKNYIDLLMHEKFCQSELPILKELDKTEIIINYFDIEDLIIDINKLFSQESILVLDKIEAQNIRFLNSHVGGFYCGAVTEDEKLLVTGGYDTTIRVWDLVNRSQSFVLYGHNSYVKCLVLTKSSRKIISGSFDASVRIWSIKHKSQVAVLKGHESSIFAVCYQEAQSLIISGDLNGVLIIWDFNKHEILNKLNCSGGVYSIIFIRHEYSFILGTYQDISFYDISTNKILKTIQSHSNVVSCLALTNDEQTLVSGSFDEKIIIWDLNTYTKLFEITVNTEEINSLALTSNDQSIVSGSNDCSISVWCIKTGNLNYKITEHTFIVNSIIRLKNIFFSLSGDSGIGQLNLETSEFEVNWFLTPFNSSCEIIQNCNKEEIAFASGTSCIIWDSESQTNKSVVASHQDIIENIEISTDLKFALTCARGYEGNLFYWNLENNQKIGELKGHSLTVLCANFSKDNLRAASGSDDRTVKVWSLGDLVEEFELIGHTDSVYSIKFINRKKFVASAGGDNKIILWNLIDRTQFTVIGGHDYSIYKILVTDDERHVVSCDHIDGIRVWDLDQKLQEMKFSYEMEAVDWLNENKIALNSVKRYLKS